MLTYLRKAVELQPKNAASVFKGCLIAGGGAIAVMLLEYATSLDLGKWSPLVAAMSSVVINYIRKKINENKNTSIDNRFIK